MAEKFVRLIREDEVSGVDLNIAYGDTAPTDTSKLWVSGAEPSKVSTAFSIEGNETITAGVGALPTEAYGIGVAAVGKKVYLFGGRGSIRFSTINCFDTETNTITTLSATLPETAYSIGTAAVGTKVYLFGGQSGSTIFKTINCFDTETNTISTLSATLPAVASSIGTAAVGTKIFLFGGYSGLSTINCFDTKTNTISTLSVTLPEETYGIGAAAIGTKIYLFGGQSDSGKLSTINCFDTETNTITTLSATLPNEAYSIGTAAVGTKVYLFGGNGSIFLSTINLFSVSLDLPTDNLLLHLSATENYFNLINTDKATIEVGVQGVYRGNADGVGEMETAYLHNGTDWVEV